LLPHADAVAADPLGADPERARAEWLPRCLSRKPGDVRAERANQHAPIHGILGVRGMPRRTDYLSLRAFNHWTTTFNTDGASTLTR
jgi:hypothetical protein